LIKNGGFEGSIAPWVASGRAVYSNSTSYSHSGTGYVYLGGTNYATGIIYQQFTVPSVASSVNLSFWLRVTTQETGALATDRLYVEVRSTTGALLQTIATYSNLNGDSVGTYAQKGTFNLSAYKGRTVKLYFRVANNAGLPTTFRIDDISVLKAG